MVCFSDFACVLGLVAGYCCFWLGRFLLGLVVWLLCILADIVVGVLW